MTSEEPRLARAAWIAALLGLVTLLLVSCASSVPKQQDNVCAVFEQHPAWYDYARKSEETWGTPKSVQMAFVRQESSFRKDARPPRRWFLFIPLGRVSSARGYAQAQNPVWREYQAERGSVFRGRGDMEDALDFIGWYNHRSHRRLGLSKAGARELYYAYHEGHAGYRRGNHTRRRGLTAVAAKVERTAANYAAQLAKCEERFRCRKLWQVGPLCS